MDGKNKKKNSITCKYAMTKTYLFFGIRQKKSIISYDDVLAQLIYGTPCKSAMTKEYV